MKGKKIMDTDDILQRGVERIFPTADAFRAVAEKKAIKIYFGIDPTGPTLHIGHGIALKKLRDLQRLGHKIVLLIGDFTAQIGDPSDKSAARTQLTHEQVMENCRVYKKQAEMFLDFASKTNPAELVFNSTWTDKLTVRQLMTLMSEFTVQQLLERDMFRERLKNDKPIYFHELAYPLFQGYDSVAMGVDAEIGGNDQTFNMLVGRDMMKRRDKEKFVIAMKLLEDPTGAKMGKTTGNMITFNDAPEDMYGKVMAWTDGMIPLGFELCTDVPMNEVREIEKQLKAKTGNPRDVKMQLAREIVTLYHNAAKAKMAEAAFVKVFQQKDASDAGDEVKIGSPSLTVVELLVKTKCATSKSDARRLVKQGGVKINDVVVSNADAVVLLSPKGTLLQKGKRHFVRVYP